MTTLTDQLQDYLTVRRSFGYDLATTERVLRRFAEFVDQQHTEYITVAHFLSWKAQFGSANRNTWSARLGMVRGFAKWLHALAPQHEVPPQGLVTGSLRRSRPFIYTKEQIARIISTAALLPSDYGLRGSSCATLLGLIAVTGMRISEAIGLDECDVDLNEAVLTVRRGKNGKSRFLPLTASTMERLADYRTLKSQFGKPDQPAFFQFEHGRRPSDCGLRYNFAQICQKIGLRTTQQFKKHGRGPRIHDLRHTFAVETILKWYRNDLDPDREMVKLSTYLGHSNPEHTYWYIEAVPELLKLAAERAEKNVINEEHS